MNFFGPSLLLVIHPSVGHPLGRLDYGEKRSAAQFFDDAAINGHEPLAETDLNGDRVSKKLEDGTEVNYQRMLVLWDE